MLHKTLFTVTTYQHLYRDETSTYQSEKTAARQDFCQII